MRNERRIKFWSLGMVAATLALTLGAWWDLSCAKPARSERILNWEQSGAPTNERGAALFSYGDFGALDLDVLATSAVPWPLLAASLGLHEEGGKVAAVTWSSVEAAFQRFGFLYPMQIRGLSGTVPASKVPYGFSVGTVGRVLPPLRLQVLNIGCPACHAGPAYLPDGSPDTTLAVPGMPNTSVDLEAFTLTSYTALKAATAIPDDLLATIARLFPQMVLAERVTMRWLALPLAKQKLQQLQSTGDRPLPFSNGAPGLTNGVAALKNQLGILKTDEFDSSAGFVSIPVLFDRFFRSALLTDGAYAIKGQSRFKAKTRADADQTDAHALAHVASFFLVPSMGMTDARVEKAIPDLEQVMHYLRELRPPHFPGKINKSLTAAGRGIYVRQCARCHGTYDRSLVQPRLLKFPNWAGDVGTDRSRVRAFSPRLSEAVSKTRHGRKVIDAAHTGKTAAPLLTGLWATAPYFTNGSVPTVRQILEPATRAKIFSVGGHALDFVNLGILNVLAKDGVSKYPKGYTPHSKPVVIDTAQKGFSNQGHDADVKGLTIMERDALIEYLKLL